MREIMGDLDKNAPKDPMRIVSQSMKQQLPKRFYKEATVEPSGDAFAVLLDGKQVKTPARRALMLPTKAAAELVAEEWQAQAERIET